MILGKSYGYAVDLWALGVIVTLMSQNFLPFDTRCTQIRFNEKVTGEIPYLSEQYVSYDLNTCFTLALQSICIYYFQIKCDPPLYAFIWELLEKDPKDRLGYGDTSKVKQHQFFANICWSRVETLNYPPPYKPLFNQKQFHQKVTPSINGLPQETWPQFHYDYFQVQRQHDAGARAEKILQEKRIKLDRDIAKANEDFLLERLQLREEQDSIMKHKHDLIKRQEVKDRGTSPLFINELETVITENTHVLAVIPNTIVETIPDTDATIPDTDETILSFVTEPDIDQDVAYISKKINDMAKRNGWTDEAPAVSIMKIEPYKKKYLKKSISVDCTKCDPNFVHRRIILTVQPNATGFPIRSIFGFERHIKTYHKCDLADKSEKTQNI